MPESRVDLATLELTDNESEVEYYEIVHQLFQGGDVTDGKLYEAKRMYYKNPDLIETFPDGEIYIFNDLGKELYGFQLFCQLKMYKLKK